MNISQSTHVTRSLRNAVIVAALLIVLLLGTTLPAGAASARVAPRGGSGIIPIRSITLMY